MATINFPSAPAVGNTYTFNGRTWQFDGYGWERVINASQVVSVFILLAPQNEDTVTVLPGGPINSAFAFHLVNYV